MIISCKIDNCESQTQIRGYCKPHYQKWYRYGDPLKQTWTGRSIKLQPLYHTWKGMRNRCYSVNYKQYKDYGGRGILVCSEWKGVQGFHNFVSDMGDKPTPKHTLDRIDVNGNYEPSNCKWSTSSEQAKNRRPRSISNYPSAAIRYSESISSWEITVTMNRKILSRVRLNNMSDLEQVIKSLQQSSAT